MQESSEIFSGAHPARLDGEFDNRWPFAVCVGLQFAVDAEVAGRDVDPDRNAQFEYINETANDYLQRRQPVISVDTKKKAMVGDFKNAGREWQRQGEPALALGDDFPQEALGKAIPCGIYDMGCNEAWVNVGRDHDTPAFAVASIRRWWLALGKAAYGHAEELFITADAGGSNGYRSHAWKHELQQFADDTGLTVRVSHFPPGTRKWNRIEHRLFCHITQNSRGKSLRAFETIVDLIGHTRTAAGLRVRAKLDKRQYPKGVRITDEQIEALALHRHEFHGDWNYALQPRTSPKAIPKQSTKLTT